MFWVLILLGLSLLYFNYHLRKASLVKSYLAKEQDFLFFLEKKLGWDKTEINYTKLVRL